MQDLSLTLVCPHFLAKIHTAQSLTQPVSVRPLLRAVLSPGRQHTEVVSCNENVQRVSQLGSFWGSSKCCRPSLPDLRATEPGLEGEGVSLVLLLPALVS